MPPDLDLLSGAGGTTRWSESLGPGSVVLRGFALDEVPDLLAAIDLVVAQAPFRHMVTPGGLAMSVAMSNCGALGWVSDALSGYRYQACDPASGKPWPAMPPILRQLAVAAAAQGGYPGFDPDACLINRYVPGARMTLHQDKDEADYSWPIVSLSLGLPATFLFGGHRRGEHAARVPLTHGDVVVWGGNDRLRFHGVQAVKADIHRLVRACRLNLTWRKAG